ncbi:hypothetical protein, partial [Hymenobacter sp. AT01-02]|uniref:DUF6712 family protein n=1 Tax=Hymenobacter sp. AT01-02 TaxID=1571877 RepID=UPI000A40D9ED
METLLFSREDFEPYIELPQIDPGRLEPHMLRAQRRLRPVFGDALYEELKRRTELDAVEPEEGAEPIQWLTGDWVELKARAIPALVHAAAAQYWPFSQTTVVRNGIVRKKSEHSEPVDASTLAKQASIYDGEALSYEAELRSWLIAHAASFTAFYPDPSHCGCHPTGPAGRPPTVVVQPLAA